MKTARVAGVLLAAGRAERFGGDKLRAPLPAAAGEVEAGTPIGIAACRHLIVAMPRTIAVVRSGDAALAAQLRDAGARVVECVTASEGIAASLACGVEAAADAHGWVIALADMPWITPATIGAVATAISSGALLAAPFYRDTRGHPVGFGRPCYAELIALSGDEGAQSVLRRYGRALQRIEVDDPGILRDVDTREDLLR